MQLDGVPNQRMSYRVPAVGPRYARLKFQQEERLVLIVDESAEGFGVLAECKFADTLGLVVLLQTGSGWTEAKVANVSAASVPNSLNRSGESPCMRLGLIRIRDLPLKLAVASPFASLFECLWRPLRPFSSSWQAATLSVAAIVCGGLVAIVALEHPGSLTNSRELKSLWRGWMGTARQAMPGQGSFATSEQLLSDLIPLTRPETLTQPRAAEHLGLSEYQIDRLRTMASTQPDNRAMRKQALQILTRDQLVKWHLLTVPQR